MQYLCLIYEDEKEWEKLPPAESDEDRRRVLRLHRVDQEGADTM